MFGKLYLLCEENGHINDICHTLLEQAELLVGTFKKVLLVISIFPISAMLMSFCEDIHYHITQIKNNEKQYIIHRYKTAISILNINFANKFLKTKTIYITICN